MLPLETPIEKLSRVGPRNLPRLKKLGVKTVKDLLWHFPSRYEDYSRRSEISDIQEVGNVVGVLGEVVKIKTTSLWRRRRSVTEAFVRDASGTARVVWFNQPYIENSLPEGAEVSLAGKVALDKRGLYISNPQYEKADKGELIHTSRLVPVYPETEGITSKYLRFLVRLLLRSFGASEEQTLFDPLPKHILAKYEFPNLVQAIKKIHFPESLKEAEIAKKRLAFDELILFQLKSIISRRNTLKLKAVKIGLDSEVVRSFVASLPFELTNDQRVSAFEILKDLERGYPMNRLLNGDVGSGKTAVAIIAAYQTIQCKGDPYIGRGNQAVFMAPTEILAQQHFKTITSLLQGSPLQKPARVTLVRIGLLTGSGAKQWPTDEITEEKISKKLMLEKIAQGEMDIIIGTHAVIQKDVKFKNLALVVIDEQHRFGVEQRMKLVKSSAPTQVPHLLSMTATPIPRTLALTIYGDLDISLIKEKPKNRKSIVTKVVSKNKEAEAYKFLEKEVASGRQVFVICPRIELSDPKEAVRTSAKQDKMNVLWAEVKAVTEEHKKLSEKVFPHLKIAMLHGKMKPKEKEDVMSDFKAGKYHILVSTSVVEVGVDIPNASVMLIENAERFGLAQLHQFRGRVGRAEHQSYCLLVNGGAGKENKRLKALESCEDGFKLAEQDLLLRGPGEFVGTKQSGLPDLAMASLTDLDLIKKARLEAKLLLKEDPNLKNYPLLRTRLSDFQRIRHFE